MAHYDLIVAGTSFASSYFLQRWLQNAPPTARVLVLERGQRDSWSWQIANRKNTSFDDTLYEQGGIGHTWITNIGFGGGSNCWWACTPRLHPADFELRSRYGVGVDWPFGYSELEPYYEAVEAHMSISGHCDDGPFPRRVPFPQPPHNMNAVGRMLKRAYGRNMIPQPTARARVPTNRGVCQTATVCGLCPLDAKFTIYNGFRALYNDPRVTLQLQADVQTVQTTGNVATGVTWLDADTHEQQATSDLVALGTSAMYNPAVLLRSGFDDAWLGKGLNEQVSLNVFFDLDGLDSLDGSTSITGHLYEWYDGPWRSERAACLIENINIPHLRPELGKWRQRGQLKLIFEDLPEPRNHVTVNASGTPVAVYEGHSDYTQRAIDYARTHVGELLSVLPLESIEISETLNASEAHVQGTHRMGTDPASSVTDPDLVHHRVRNLLVLGAGAFPTCAPANPTLTLSALSMRAADKLTASVSL